jgi:hypothetical protein
VLLNIDKPTRTATLHVEGCSMVPIPLGTQWKLLDQMGRDGGWFTAASEVEARRVAQREFPRCDFIRCERC